MSHYNIFPLQNKYFFAFTTQFFNFEFSRPKYLQPILLSMQWDFFR